MLRGRTHNASPIASTNSRFSRCFTPRLFVATSSSKTDKSYHARSHNAQKGEEAVHTRLKRVEGFLSHGMETFTGNLKNEIGSLLAVGTRHTTLCPPYRTWSNRASRTICQICPPHNILTDTSQSLGNRGASGLSKGHAQDASKGKIESRQGEHDGKPPSKSDVSTLTGDHVLRSSSEIEEVSESSASCPTIVDKKESMIAPRMRKVTSKDGSSAQHEPMRSNIKSIFAFKRLPLGFAHTKAKSRIRKLLLNRKFRCAQSRTKGSGLLQFSPVLAKNREKAFNLEQRRLQIYNYYLPSQLTFGERFMKGQYRSLLRRNFNFRHWDATSLDLRKMNSKLRASDHIRAFAALDRGIYSKLGRHTRLIHVKHSARCRRISAKLFSNPAANLSSIRAVWLNHADAFRKTWYLKLLVYLLDCKPGRALRFIEVLVTDPFLQKQSAIVIADALGHLAKLHRGGLYDSRHGWDGSAEANRHNFLSIFVPILKVALTKPLGMCSQDLLYNLAYLASLDELAMIFNCLIQSQTTIGFDTFLHYANTFAAQGNIAYGIQCLFKLRSSLSTKAWGEVVRCERFRWTCALILRKSMSSNRVYHETPNIVAQFVGLGVEMNVLLYNVVIRNAMEAGDYETAFKVYNNLLKNNLKPTKYTYSILLHGCTIQSDPVIFTSFAKHCADIAKKVQDRWLATDYLYYTYVCHQNDTDAEGFLTLMWRTFLHNFQGRTMKDFIEPNRIGLVGAIDSQISRSDSHHLDQIFKPTPIAHYIMFQVEIKAALALGVQRVLNLYGNFKGVIDSNLSENLAKNTIVWSNLAKNPIIWNAFLLAFCQAQQFESASRVIKDMTRYGTSPNVYSWNILMQGFFKTAQVQAAERVFEIMRSRGVDPDQFTFGLMLRGYARAQLVDKIGETMKHVDQEQNMDPDLLRALAQVVDRKGLMLALETRLDKETNAPENAEPVFKTNEQQATADTSSTFGRQDRSTAQKEVSVAFRRPLMSTPTLQSAVSRTTPRTASQASIAPAVGASSRSRLSNTLQPSPSTSPTSNLLRPSFPSTQSTSPSLPSALPSPLSNASLTSSDPQLLFRKLQEDLGIVSMSPQSRAAHEKQIAEAKEKARQESLLGTDIRFKSMLGAKKWEQWEGKAVKVRRVESKELVESGGVRRDDE